MNRYKRHLLLPEVGVEGQKALLDAKVLMLGAGGLGSPAALYLAAAGVGTIGIVDMDEVDASNLQRQILHNIDRIGDRKVDSAKKTLTMLNPDVDVVTYDTRLDAENIIDIIPGYDVIVDGADNFPSRYLLNDASVKLGIPVVHGSIFRFEGMVSVFHPKQGPTYRDMVPEPPPAELAPSCAEAGVLGVLPGIIGSIQALETIKVILGLGEPLIGRILSVDTTEMEFRVFNLKPDPANEVTWANRDRIIVRSSTASAPPASPPPTETAGSDPTVSVHAGSVRTSASRGGAAHIADARKMNTSPSTLSSISPPPSTTTPPIANSNATALRIDRVATAATAMGPMNSIVTALPRSTRSIAR
jgi:sulfur-carrier protein adenylyltransferase/sulfurtransferase